MDLQMDKTSNIWNVAPDILYNQEFLLFSPRSESYCFMSQSPAITHKLHTKLKSSKDRDSENNQFQLEKVNGKDGYYFLYNCWTEKYIYVAGNDVLGVTGKPSDHKNVSKFEFYFETFGETRFYTIVCNGKYLQAPISGEDVILAADEKDDLALFQLTLKKNARHVSIKYDLDKLEKVSNLVEELNIELINDGTEETKKEYSLGKSLPATDEFKFGDELEYFGRYDEGGTILNTVDGPVNSGSFGTTEPETNDLNIREKSSVIVKPGEKIPVKIEIVKKHFVVPFEIRITTSNKKELKGSGVWYGNHHTNVSVLFQGSEDI